MSLNATPTPKPACEFPACAVHHICARPCERNSPREQPAPQGADWVDANVSGNSALMQAMRNHAESAQQPAQQAVPAGCKVVPEAFSEWLCREMPPGTVISDPAWWAPKIARAMLAAVVQKAAAWVPVHPKTGPLWAMTTDSPDPERLPAYPLRSLYYTHPALAAAPEAPAQAEQASEPVRDEREPSPTAGMTLGQRILHVGGRTNAAGYVEFGSVQAVDALVRHVLRDLPDAPPVRANAEWPREADPLTQLIQRLNSTPYNLTKDECIEVAKELRAALASTERQPHLVARDESATALVRQMLEALEHGCPPDCENGMTDSGGIHPWGEAVLVPCPTCAAITAAREWLEGKA